MANYATNADLQKLLPDILGYGVADFTDQLTFATADVLELIKVDWWREAANDFLYYNPQTYRGQAYFPTMNEAYLNTAKLVNITCYRALAHYIFPMLTLDGQSEEWNIKMERYQAFYKDEWAVLKRAALYDFDQDSQFEDLERHDNRGRRVIRG